MALAPNALSTLATFKSFAGVNGNAQDTMLEIILSGASEFIEKWTGRRFRKETRTEKITGYGESSRVYLKATPVHSVAAVTADGVAVVGADYIVDTEDGYLASKTGPWPAGAQSIVIEYVGGYVLPKDANNENPRTLPYDVEMAALKLATAYYNRSEIEGANSSSSGGMSVSFDGVFGEDIKALLRNYREIHV